MLFPETPREVYSKNPLVRVSCRFEFPKILAILKGPSEFQDKIRQTYSHLNERKRIDEIPKHYREAILQVPELAKILATGGLLYCFSTADSAAFVELDEDSIEIGVHHYSDWDLFLAEVLRIEQIFRSVYSPASYEYLSLEYQNLISRKALKTKARWKTLLNEKAVGLLCSDLVGSKVVASRALAFLDASELCGGGAQVRIEHGVAETTDDNFAYAIDSRFLKKGRIEIADVRETLDCFNRENGNLFRWFVTPSLRKLLGPEAK